MLAVHTHAPTALTGHLVELVVEAAPARVQVTVTGCNNNDMVTGRHAVRYKGKVNYRRQSMNIANTNAACGMTHVGMLKVGNVGGLYLRNGQRHL